MYDPVYLCKKAFFIPSYTVYHSDSSLTDSVILFNTAGLDLTPGCNRSIGIAKFGHTKHHSSLISMPGRKHCWGIGFAYMAGIV